MIMKLNLLLFLLTHKHEKVLDDIFESIYTTIISNICNILEKVLVGLLTQLSTIDHIINISKYNPLAGKLPKELNYLKKL